MTEPLMELSAKAQREHQGLWEKAPAWRTLAVVASLLTLTAVALPVLLPQEAAITPPPAAPPEVTLVSVTPQVTLPSFPAAPTHVAVATPSLPVHTATISTPAAIVPKPVAPAAQMASLPTPTQMSPAAPLQPAPVPAPVQDSASQPGNVCAINMPEQSQPMGGGTVIGYEAPAAAQQRMLANQRVNGGLINPAYANTPRAIVRTDGTPPGGQAQIVVLPPGVTVNVGDRITFNSAHRDMSMPCGYIPPLLAADIGPSPAANTPPADARAAPSP